MSKILTKKRKAYLEHMPQEMTLEEYVERIKTDESLYLSPTERLLTAIGEPKIVNTAEDDRLSRIHGNRVIKVYDAFSDFYGIEESIEQIVDFIKYAALGLEETKQVLYLLGPVGSAKSSLAERIKELMSKIPIYIIKGSPMPESPLGLFGPEDAEDLGIHKRYLRFRPTPWAIKKLKEFDGDLSKFVVEKVYPSEAKKLGIAVVHPKDENTQDISDLVGKVDIRKLEYLSQDDPEAYSYSGGLCRGNMGVMEFVEMFKASTDVINPMLTATQEGTFVGTENIGAMPFDGLILAHSNESEWEDFCANSRNEAFLDRVSIIKVPYCIRLDEEVKIYKKYIGASLLSDAPVAPGTLEMLASLSVMSRISPPGEGKGDLECKLHVYNGESVKDKYPEAESALFYKKRAPRSEGFGGLSTREAFKIISRVFNYDSSEIAADPVHMRHILIQAMEKEEISEEERVIGMSLINGPLTDSLMARLRKDIQTAYLDSYEEFGQNLFDKYVLYAGFWIDDKDYRDPDTGRLLDREALNEYLTKIEKPAGISNPKDFRAEVVRFSLVHRASHDNENPAWHSYAKMKEVLEANMFSNTEDLLPVISFSGGANKENKGKHREFVKRMQNQGYTAAQAKRMVDFYLHPEKKS